MGSALLDTDLLDQAVADASCDSVSAAARHANAATDSAASREALRRQVGERLAAHRARHSPAQPAHASAARPAPPVHARATRIAATVAQRYANSPSYREFLAAEAERASQQAQAAAHIAALNAQAVAEAQQRLLASFEQAEFEHGARGQASLEQTSLDRQSTGHESLLHAQNDFTAPLPSELSLWPESEPSEEPAITKAAPSLPKAHPRAHVARAYSEPIAPARPGLTVRLFGEPVASPLLGAAQPAPASSRAVSRNRHRSSHEEDRNEAEARLLDEEIAFRQAPVFDEPIGPPVPLPANLIEFPRQLVAPRKARPRYAEGPLRDVSAPALGEGQLRIFEVDPAHISTTPVSAEAPTPQWTSIWLDSPSSDSFGPEPASSLLSTGVDRLSSQIHGEVEAERSAFSPPRTSSLPQIASINRRLLASAIDAAILLAGVLAFIATFAIAAGSPIHGSTAETLSIAATSLDRHSALTRLSAHAAAQLTAHTGLQPSLALATSVLVLVLFYLLYQTLFFSFSESTPGMRYARIALCTFDDENPTRRAMRRRILAVLVSLCPFGLGLLWASLDEDRLAWHDRLTRTYQRSY